MLYMTNPVDPVKHILKYVTDSAITSSGVFKSLKIRGDKVSPIMVRITEKVRPTATVVCTARSVALSSFAPIQLDMTIPAPTDTPMKKPMNKN